jgi:hypothetical protein
MPQESTIEMLLGLQNFMCNIILVFRLRFVQTKVTGSKGSGPAEEGVQSLTSPVFWKIRIKKEFLKKSVM